MKENGTRTLISSEDALSIVLTDPVLQLLHEETSRLCATPVRAHTAG